MRDLQKIEAHAIRARKAAFPILTMPKLNPDRIEISWRSPGDFGPEDCAPLIDTGGWIYRIFSNGRLFASGSAKGDIEVVKVRLTASAATMGLHNLPFHVSPPPSAPRH